LISQLWKNHLGYESFENCKSNYNFSSLSYLSITFLRNYNSLENIEKRCKLKFEKDFKSNLEIYNEEWNQILDLADNNYLKCMGIPKY